jgi:hypothetical protein
VLRSPPSVLETAGSMFFDRIAGVSSPGKHRTTGHRPQAIPGQTTRTLDDAWVGPSYLAAASFSPEINRASSSPIDKPAHEKWAYSAYGAFSALNLVNHPLGRLSGERARIPCFWPLTQAR